METEELEMGTIHHGHNIKRVRRMKGIKQLALADTLDMSQQSISRYESTQSIEEKMLKQFAKALDVPVEYLKTIEENASSVVFENNSVTNNNNAEGATSATNSANSADNIETNDNSTKTFNPVEKLVELYERMLKEEKEKNVALEQRLVALEEKLGK